ncbi:MAG: hypothetical protein WCT14_20085 [Treponemataceae bacterium]
MQIDINPRGNGACPLCVQNGSCRMQKALSASVVPFPDSDEASTLELVVYSCPKFKEKG